MAPFDAACAAVYVHGRAGAAVFTERKKGGNSVRIRWLVIACVLLCAGCQKAGASSAPPEWQRGGSGVYRASINGDSRSGTFQWTDFRFVIRPDCTDCAPVSWSYDGAQYTIESGSASVSVSASVFPANSMLRVLPQLACADTIEWRTGADGWTGEIAALTGTAFLTMQNDGKINRLTFPAANASIELIYSEK